MATCLMETSDMREIGLWYLLQLGKDTKRIIEIDILPDMVKFLEQILSLLPQLRLRSAAKTTCCKLPEHSTKA